MSGRTRLTLGVIACFVAAIIGVFMGRALLPSRAQPGAELHDVLHHKLALDATQEARLQMLEQRFAVQRRAFELELRADNARLAEAIEAEHGNGPRVAAAVDQSHAAMGDLQKATLAHIFAMRQLLRPNQTGQFDQAVVKALTDDVLESWCVSLDWTTLTEGELAALSIAGRQAAFSEIMRRHRQSVFRMVRACVGEADEALDLVQETFVAAHQALPRYDGDRSMRAWLSTIAINKCRDWGRKRTVRRFLSFAAPIGPEAEAVADDQVAIDDATGDRQELERVTRAISTLPANLKEPLVLRTIEGLSQAETAEVLGISEKAVETRLYRARRSLADRLGAMTRSAVG